MSSTGSNYYGPKRERPTKTCDICKLRHQKCDGVRPLCHHCLFRGLQCNYSSRQAHKTKESAARRKSVGSATRLTDLSSSQDRSSQTESSVEAAQDTWAIREILMNELGSLNLPPEKKEELSRAIAEKVARRSDSATKLGVNYPSHACAVECTQEYLVSTLGQFMAKELGRPPEFVLEAIPAKNREAQFTSTMLLGGVISVSSPFEQSLPPKSQARRWLNTFLNGPNQLYCICDPSESQHQLDALYGSEGMDEVSHSVISFQISVGARFSEDTPDHIHSTWYERGQKSMEKCVEEKNGMFLWLLQPVLLGSVYFMNVKSNACWLILGNAIRIAQTYRIDQDHEYCSYLSKKEYSRWRQVWLGIVTLDAWLAANLGRLAQISENTTTCDFIRNTLSNIGYTQEHSLQINLTRLAVIIGKILQDIYIGEEVHLRTYETCMNMLEAWTTSLPQSLRFHSDHSDDTSQSSLSKSDELASLYLEIYYLGTVLFLTRPLLLHSVTTRGKGFYSMTPTNVRYFAQTWYEDHGLFHVWAFNTRVDSNLGHIAYKMVKRGIVCKKSWFVTTLDFNAALALVWSLSGKESKTRYNLTSAQAENRRHMEKNGLEACNKVLAYCAQQDTYASHYLKVIQTFQGMIEDLEGSNLDLRADPVYITAFSRSTEVEKHPLIGSQWSPSTTTSYESLTSLSNYPTNTSSMLDIRSYPTSSAMSGSTFDELFPTSSSDSSAPNALPTGLFLDPTYHHLQWLPFSFNDSIDAGAGGMESLPDFPYPQNFHPQSQPGMQPSSAY